MKKIFASLLFLSLILTVPTTTLFAEGDAAKAAAAGLKKAESKFVCMINNQVMDREQIPVEIDGKIYYGCCAMCKERLAKDLDSRKAVDPISGKDVDKATAVIGADARGDVHYFENEKNLEAYNAKLKG